MDPRQQELGVGGPHGHCKPLFEYAANAAGALAPMALEEVRECADDVVRVLRDAAEAFEGSRFEGKFCRAQILVFVVFCGCNVVRGCQQLVFAALRNPRFLEKKSPDFSKILFYKIKEKPKMIRSK